MDGTAAGLERDPRTAVDSTLPDACPNNTAGAGGQGSARAVRGAPMNGGLAPPLTSISAGVILHTRRQSDKSAAAHMDDPALFMPHLEFTQNLGLTRVAPMPYTTLAQSPVDWALSKVGCVYSQAKRTQENIFDCSSLVAPAYSRSVPPLS